MNRYERSQHFKAKNSTLQPINTTNNGSHLEFYAIEYSNNNYDYKNEFLNPKSV